MSGPGDIMSVLNVRRDGAAPDNLDPALDTFRILYVCSANICRSVMAERLTRLMLLARPNGQGLRFRVSSAGLQAMVGEQAHPYTAAALARMGANVTGFVSRQLTAALIGESDLVLTATVRHRDKAVGMLPAASRRIFTLREFARIAGHLRDFGYPASETGVAQRARWVVDAVATLRGQVGHTAPAADDIADPARRRGAFRSCARGIAVAVDDSVQALCS
jgi:protein-tyrosine phosphatase